MLHHGSCVSQLPAQTRSCSALEDKFSGGLCTLTYVGVSSPRLLLPQLHPHTFTLPAEMLNTPSDLTFTNLTLQSLPVSTGLMFRDCKSSSRGKTLEECASMSKWKVTDPRSLLPSSSSSRSEGGLVRGGQERVDTFRARMDA